MVLCRPSIELGTANAPQMRPQTIPGMEMATSPSTVKRLGPGIWIVDLRIT